MNAPERTQSGGPDASTQDEKQEVALERIHDHTLPEAVGPLIESYETIVGDRDEFLWKWAHHLFPKFTLSCVPREHVETAEEAKLVGLIFVSILDDVAEKHRDWATFEEAAKIPFRHHTVNHDRAGADGEILSFAEAVWDHLEVILDEGPRAREFDGIVQFDLKQVCTAMEYSYLVNQNVDVITESELQTYDSHNMMMYGFADIDLIYSPAFDRSELSTLRRVIERAQRMVRIGNWISTWERELLENDFTSGIVAYALDHDLVSVEELRTARRSEDQRSMERISDRIRENDVEAVFLRQWDDELTGARGFEEACDSVDIGEYLDGIETIMEYHLATRGLK